MKFDEVASSKLHTQMASAFLDLGGINFPTRCRFLTLYSPYGADASLNKLLLLLPNSQYYGLICSGLLGISQEWPLGNGNEGKLVM